jgi:hypothetical protein
MVKTKAGRLSRDREEAWKHPFSHADAANTANTADAANTANTVHQTTA